MSDLLESLASLFLKLSLAPTACDAGGRASLRFGKHHNIKLMHMMSSPRPFVSSALTPRFPVCFPTDKDYCDSHLNRVKMWRQLALHADTSSPAPLVRAQQARAPHVPGAVFARAARWPDCKQRIPGVGQYSPRLIRPTAPSCVFGTAQRKTMTRMY